MRHPALALFLLLSLAACSGSSSDGITSVPGRGAISIQVVPNPIVATKVSGETYDFPFEVVVRETGGRPVTVTNVSVAVNGPLGLNLYEENWDAARIRSMGYNPSLAANSELRMRITPRKEVPDDRLFSSVVAELRVDAVDDGGVSTTATTSVTVRR
ncbi:MAG: hypothetical protein ABI779_16540 [Acidobacteriota bacterium]